ncbi:MAG: excinuclease ABC subunit UvrC, partial [Candidatus Aureabacteria bacterium]|nr:excinuclease ABC subunit UvrC [Candidatus Auribacterota bacterium]
DDTAPAHIRVSLADDFPSATVVRRVETDGGRYFGPYHSADAARRTLRFLQRAFSVRGCSAAEYARRKRPCVAHQIRRCAGPCRGLVSRERYAMQVGRVMLFLKGKTGDLLKQLAREMEQCAARLEFERAGSIRDTIASIRATVEQQKIITADGADRDVVGIYREGARGEAAILCVRGGRLIGRRSFPIHDAADDERRIVRDALAGHYLSGVLIPPEIILPVLPEDVRVLEARFAQARAGAVRFRAPKRGKLAALVRMAASNAEAAYAAACDRGVSAALLGERLRDTLRCGRVPGWVECVDISNLGPSSAVGALVSFRDGLPDKSGFRKFSIKTVIGVDDCRMIHEVVSRRARRGLASWGMPDLMSIDGGRGQLGAALRALKETGVAGTAVVALAKGRVDRGQRTPERVFIEGRKNPIRLRDGEPVTLFLQRVRDEAHRFALRYHRGVRGKRMLGSSGVIHG